MGWATGVRFPAGAMEEFFFLFATACRLPPGPSQSPIQWVPEAFSLGIKRLGLRMRGAIPSLPHTSSWHGA